MQRLLLLALFLIAAACSRDAAENRNPGGDPARPLPETVTTPRSDTSVAGTSTAATAGPGGTTATSNTATTTTATVEGQP